MSPFLTYRISFLLLSWSLTGWVARSQDNQSSLLNQDRIIDQVLVFKLKDAANLTTGNLSKSAMPTLPFEVLGIEQVKRPSNTKRKAGTTSKSILDGIYKVRLLSGDDVIEKCAELMKMSHIQYAEPIFKEQLLFTPSDPDASPSSGNQPYLESIKAYDAWNITKGSTDLVIGIIDTGADLDNADLQDNLYIRTSEIINGIDDDGNGYIDDRNGYDFADSDAIPESDSAPHGSAVSSLAAADTDNGIGMSGIGFNTKFSPLKVFRSANNLSSGVYDAVVYAADNGYDVINLSLGSTSSYSQFSQDVINYAVVEKNVVVVAAAGNSNKDEFFYPASYDNVLSVAATNLDDSKSSFSTYNNSVDVSAPGTSIYSAFNDVYGSDNGTSYSSPMVAGVAALVKSRFPELTAKQIMERVRVTADNHYTVNSSFTGKLGSGRVNAFRAVSETNVKSVRAKNINVSGSNGGLLYFGDSIFISLTIENILDPINELSLSLTSANGEINFINSSDLGSLSTGEIKSATIIKGIIDNETTPGSTIEIGVSFSGENYTDYQQFSVQTQPDYISFTNQSTVLPIGGNGELARVNSGTSGAGIILNGITAASEVGIIFSSDFDEVADNAPVTFGTSTKSLDFQTEEFIKPYGNSVADVYNYSVFNDKGEIGLKVEQSAMAWQSLDSGLVLNYRIINVSGTDISDLSTGIFTNWNLGNSNENRATWNGNDMAYTYVKDANFFAGVKVLSTGTLRHSSLDIGNSNGNTQDIVGNYNDSLKHRFLAVEQLTSAGMIGNGNNVAQVLGSSLGNINNNDFRTVTYLIAFGTSLADLNQRIANLETLHQDFVGNPPVAERFFSCPGGTTTIDPVNGTLFNFYEDAGGNLLISSGSSLPFGPVTKDSVIYAASTDSAYLGAIRSVPVTYVPQVAGFEFSPETVFLGENQNLATFTDKSFSPITWNWDFGNGNFATVQHPKIIYNSTGTYTTKLIVTTEQGCTGNASKNIVVADRPSILGLGAITICKGENALLNAGESQIMRIYNSKDATNFSFEGNEYQLENVQKDTTLYISKLINEFESDREIVLIETKEISPSFSVLPALDNLKSHQMWLINTTSDKTGTKWFTESGITTNADTLTFNVVAGEQSFTLESYDQFGCSGSTSFTKNFTSSPKPKFEWTDVICANDAVTINPENGIHFAFYENSGLTMILHKGFSFEVDSIDTERNLYVVGLDNGLPGEVLTVTLTPKVSNLDIQAIPEVLYLDNARTVQLNTDTMLISPKWYINGQFSEAVQAPVLSFMEEDTFQIKVQGFDSDNCYQEAVLDYLVVAKTPVVLGNDIFHFNTAPYPNPTNHVLNIPLNQPVHTLILIDGAGKEVKRLSNPEIKGNHYELDVSALERGIYYLEIDGFYEQQSIRFIKR